MRYSFVDKRFINVFIPMLLLLFYSNGFSQGIRTKNIKSDSKPNSTTGTLLITLTQDYPYYITSSIKFRSLANPQKTGTFSIKSGPKNKNSPIRRHFVEELNSELYAINLEPGKYEFYRWSVFKQDGVSSTTTYPSIATSFIVDVFPSKVTYVGNFNFKLNFNKVWGTRYVKNAQPVINNKYENDVKYFLSQYKNFNSSNIISANVDNRVWKFQSEYENLNNDYFFHSDSIGVLIGSLSQKLNSGTSSFLYFTNNNSISDVITCNKYPPSSLNVIENRIPMDSAFELNQTIFLIELPVGEYFFDRLLIADWFDKPFKSKSLNYNDLYGVVDDSLKVKFSVFPNTLNYIGDIQINTII